MGRGGGSLKASPKAIKGVACHLVLSTTIRDLGRPIYTRTIEGQTGSEVKEEAYPLWTTVIISTGSSVMIPTGSSLGKPNNL